MKRLIFALATLSLPADLLAQTMQNPSAQTGAATSPTLPLPNPAARDPLALPGDNLPPAISAVVAPPRPPAAPGTPAQQRPIVAGPKLEVALEAAQAAIARCRADNLTIGVSVSDSLGVIVVGLQMTGANPGRIYNAARKNIAAIEFGVPNSETLAKIRAKDFDTLSRTRPNMTLFAGAVPLIKDGKVIGAIGVSGASSAQDEVCAAAGAAAVAGKL